MKEKTDEVYLKHILDAIQDIGVFSKDLTFDDLTKNRMAQSAIVRQLEIIGEASKNIETTFKNENPQIPWRDIEDMRNKLIHEYFGVDLEIVWKTIKEDLFKLKEQILEILKI